MPARSNRYLRISGGFIERTPGPFDFLAKVRVGNRARLNQIDRHAEQFFKILHQPEVAVGVIRRRFGPQTRRGSRDRFAADRNHPRALIQREIIVLRRAFEQGPRWRPVSQRRSVSRAFSINESSAFSTNVSSAFPGSSAIRDSNPSDRCPRRFPVPSGPNARQATWRDRRDTSEWITFGLRVSRES
jgi:hypothetical protein